MGYWGAPSQVFNETMAIDEGLINGSVFIKYVGWHLKNNIPTSGLPGHRPKPYNRTMVDPGGLLLDGIRSTRRTLLT